MDDRDLIPAIFLYTKGREGIDGATRFQKLVFLAQEETDLSEEYEFEPDRYGPYSRELARRLELLDQWGYVERDVVRNEYGNEKVVYSLTVDGIQAIQELLERGRLDRVFEASQRVKTEYNRWSLDRLLQYVYRKYDEYTTETELDTERLFDPEADSEFHEAAVDSVPLETVTDVDVERGDEIEKARVFQNADESWTARDVEIEITAHGGSRTEALENLALVIAASEGRAGHEPSEEELRELGLDPESATNPEGSELPEYMG